MKKIIFLFFGLVTLCISSCDDMLEVDSSREISGNESISHKTDSLFYVWGIMQAMQEAADMYVLQNEVRGDLISLTRYTTNHLRTLADYTATTTNKYDSAYVYYKVINNCNNFIAHRDTSLYDASYNVTLQEYASVLTFRAWAYLQLARVYGRVKFFTNPLTSLSQIENDKSPYYDIKQIVEALAPELERFSGYSVPSYADINCGRTNLGVTKMAVSKCLYIPVDVILGEMYLEIGEWMKAAKHYYDYLYTNKIIKSELLCGNWVRYNEVLMAGSSNVVIPNDMMIFSSNSWANSLISTSSQSGSHIISYIPMAVNYLRGHTTELPKLFGYDYYATDRNDLFVEAQLLPSKEYKALADSSDFYYVSQSSSNALGTIRNIAKIGDMRAYARVEEREVNDTINKYPNLYNQGNIILYRSTTLWLHLAEALNRAKYPDVAFAILKDGINSKLLTDTTYIKEQSKILLTTTLPFLSVDGLLVFEPQPSNRNYGIHAHGCSDPSDGIGGTFSPYQFDTIVGMKIKQLEQTMGIVPTGTMADTINAVEDLLCDEYAMEFAFEGNRFTDLTRLARHKNEDNPYSSDFGSRWFKNKMKRVTSVDLSIEENWYLPLK